jgi:hypothetical protein
LQFIQRKIEDDEKIIIPREKQFIETIEETNEDIIITPIKPLFIRSLGKLVRIN